MKTSTSSGAVPRVTSKFSLPMKSMTGFGLGEAPLGHGRLVVEVRTVNHRFLDVRVRLPKELTDSAMFVEQSAREKLSRGRCEICVRIEGPGLFPVTIDIERARSALKAFATVRDELMPNEALPMSLLGCIPDLFVASVDQQLPSIREALSKGLKSSLINMDSMRQREGKALAVDLAGRTERLRTLTEQVHQRLPDVVEGFRHRIRERVRHLLSSTDITLDENRLEQEVVLFADRTDITEELTRLRIHIEGINELLHCQEPVGRRLDFLLQEMGREINTIGSKSQDALIARLVVEAKSELERMREQVQNVE
jgi:uncharacterized protein (TIGR00255 family)